MGINSYIYFWQAADGIANPVGGVFVGSDANTRLTFGANGSVRLEWDGNQFYPINTGVKNLGHPSFMWQNIYATNGTIITSDARRKKNIRPSTLGSAFVRGLRPVDYEWNNPEWERGVRPGLLAQDVAAIAPEFGAIHYDDKHVASGLNYALFVMPLIKAFQELAERVVALEAQGDSHGRE
jgi:hypothetical protein